MQKKTSKIAILLFNLISLTILTVCLLIGFVWTFASVVGSPTVKVKLTTLYFADNNEIIGETSNGQKRFWVPLDQISPRLIEATLAVEDRSFYQHHGFDYKRIAGAILADVKALKKVQGASTISQQYARNLFLSPEKTWNRKLQEAFYTFRIEANYSKKEILEGYLNTIYFGHGMYGVQAASQFFFHKDANDLDLAEISMLVGIPKGPNIYSPLVSETNAKTRQQVVLSSLFNAKKISQVDMQNALTEKLQIYGWNDLVYQPVAPYFQDEVKKEVGRLLQDQKDEIKHGGLRVYTTLNIANQKVAEETVASTIPQKSEAQVAVISIDPQTGQVKALVGGRDYTVSSFNRATQALRQPGSTVKPILYYAALEKGFTPSTMIRSELTTFTYNQGRQKYIPHNYNNKYANKDITMIQALAVSDNIYAVKTHMFLGEKELIKTAKQFGITSKMEEIPSLALGTFLVKPIEMTNAYNMFANSGEKVNPVYITKITNYKGEILYDWKQEKDQVLDKGKAFVMAEMMKGIFDTSLNGYASVTGASIKAKLTYDYSAKSGSTSSDSWMIGFTPELTTGVWVGYDDNRPLDSFADQKYAKTIWSDLMEKALGNVASTDSKVPNNVVAVKIDPESGLLASKNCPTSHLTYFVKGTEPIKECTLHQREKKQENYSNKNQKKNKEKEEKKWYEFWKEGF